MPTVSKRLASMASFNFVPTPSVAASKTGSLYPFGSSNAPAKEPIPPRTFGVKVDFTKGLIASTKALPASISTPASL